MNTKRNSTTRRCATTAKVVPEKSGSYRPNPITRNTICRWPTHPAWQPRRWPSPKSRTTFTKYTGKGNLVAVISNGTAVLGLGNIGPLAAKPVMEGKSMLFKTYAGIDAFDIEVDTTDPEEFIRTVKAIAPTFGGHQSRRHQGSGVLRDREPPARGTEHPPNARRPARHGDHLLGGTSERRENRRQGAGQNARRGQRRGSRRHRLRAPVRGTRHPPRKRGALRQPWSRHGLPRGHQPDEARIRHHAAHHDAGRGAARRRRVPGRLEGRHADARDAAHDVRQSDRHGPRQPRSRNRLRHGDRLASRHHLRHGPLRLPQPGQQRTGLPLYLPGCARRAGHEDQRGDETRRGARAGRTDAPTGSGHGPARLRGREARIRAHLPDSQTARSAPAVHRRPPPLRGPPSNRASPKSPSRTGRPTRRASGNAIRNKKSGRTDRIFIN